MVCKIEFPAKWINSLVMERALSAGFASQESSSSEVVFRFPAGCKVMIDAAVRLLSLFNQIDLCSRRVRLEFDEGQEGAMGYLNRMGFFDHLASRIEIIPNRPSFSAADLYGGTNASLVEIARINREARDATLLSRLTEALMRSCGHRSDAKELEGAAWTIFAELIDNVFSHSQTPLDGYAALQLYQGGNTLKVAVSDSGLGIMDTLRPALIHESPALAALSDINLLVEIFRLGISRHGADRGCGLKGCAAKAMKYQAELDIRLPHIRVLLAPGKEGYRPNTAYCYDSLSLIWGTHICFNFSLDSRN